MYACYANLYYISRGCLHIWANTTWLETMKMRDTLAQSTPTNYAKIGMDVCLYVRLNVYRYIKAKSNDHISPPSNQ